MAEWILANQPNCTIIGIDNLSGGYQDYVPAGVDFHQLDLSKDTIAALFEGADIVYHFAAYSLINKFYPKCISNDCIESLLVIYKSTIEF